MKTSQIVLPFQSYCERQLNIFWLMALTNVLAAGVPILRKHLPKEDEILHGYLNTLLEDGSIEKNPELIRRFCYETLVCKAVDDFKYYLSDTLLTIFISKPDALKTKEQISIEEALRYDNREDLVTWLAEKKATSLMYKGIDNVLDFFKNKLGIKHDLPSLTISRAKSAVALRNLYVHKRGIADCKFLQTYSDCSFTAGEYATIPREEVQKCCNSLFSIAEHLNGLLVSKFE